MGQTWLCLCCCRRCVRKNRNGVETFARPARGPALNIALTSADGIKAKKHVHHLRNARGALFDTFHTSLKHQAHCGPRRRHSLQDVIRADEHKLSPKGERYRDKRRRKVNLLWEILACTSAWRWSSAG